jgi:HK97 gp10 family phage protein
MAGAMRVEIGNLGELRGQLDVLKRTLRNRILRQAAVKAARIMAKLAKQNAPVEIGTDNLSRARAGQYKRSIGWKVAILKDGSIVAIAGARRGFRKVIGVRVRGKNVGKEVVTDPAKIAHLVEFGSVRSQARPHIRPAIEAAKGPILEAVTSTIQAGLERLNKGR